MTAAGTCTLCGRPMDLHSKHVRFRLPDPVLASPDQERAEGIWQNDADPIRSVMMQVPRIGAFIRALLPVRLTGGYTVTYGVWLGVHPEDLQRAFREWWAPTYGDLVLDGLVANDVQPWGLVARPARATVHDPNETPYVDSSTDELLAKVLADEWPHDHVLDALPGSLGER